MTNQNDSGHDLRKRAEKYLKRKLSDFDAESTLSTQALRDVVHELQVHQIELEMQNEELTEAHLALQLAHDKYIDLYDYAPVGYITVDNKGIIHEANLTATHLMGINRASLVGKPISRFVFKDDLDTCYSKLQQVFENQKKLTCELRLVKETGDQFHAQIEGMTVDNKEGPPASALLALLDITERKQIEQEKERLVVELQDSLAKVKKLSGFLPICASCKKIRDDKGYWRQVEEYVSDHSEALFSHGICPDCMRKLYPEFADEVLEDLDKDKKI
jgi:hypothetical protein